MRLLIGYTTKQYLTTSIVNTKLAILDGVRFECWHSSGKCVFYLINLRIGTVHFGSFSKCNSDVVIFKHVMSTDGVAAASKA